MTALGIRCSNKDFAYAVLDGTKSNPSLVAHDIISFPKGYSTPFKLKWLLQELEDMVRRYSIGSIAMKGTEGLAARGKPFVERVECESIVFLAGATTGIKRVRRKIKSSIAKDLGFKGKGRYLNSKLDTSLITSFESLNAKEQEAVIVGWSDLE